MPSVRLRFAAPPTDDIWVKLHIYESPTIGGSFNEIEQVTDVGEAPNYINGYTTDQALSVDDWFTIQWEDSKGAKNEISNPVQGRTETYVGEITSRVLLRDSSLDENVVIQEAAVAISKYKHTEDPFHLDEPLTYVEKRGLTNLTLAMVYLTEMTQGQASQWSAGIVSMKINDNVSKNRMIAIDRLIRQANVDLHQSFSMIALMEEVPVAGGITTVEVDQSRLLIELR